jgi:hypothetical protein
MLLFRKAGESYYLKNLPRKIMHTTLTAALEVLLDLPPLNLVMEGEVSRTLSRVSLVLKRKVNYSLSSARGSRIQNFIDSIRGDMGVEKDTIVPVF